MWFSQMLIFRGHPWEAFGPRWFQDCSRCPKMASKFARWSKGLNDLHHASKGLHGAPKTVPSGLGASRRRPPEARILQTCCSMTFAFSPFRFRWAFEVSRWPQDGPREPQEGPKTAPRAPKSAPRAGQESPRTALLSLRGGDPN